uniref:Integrase catalytic domain-containing protein n=1 Tax=Trichogramma kaykai TaxID=54128 RepID=A0ABD2X950_9HYME
MDILEPLPLTITGNKYILTLQCNLIKYSEAIPLPDVKADMIASVFANEFICRFGYPQTLRTDMSQN